MWAQVGVHGCVNIQRNLPDIRWTHLWGGSPSCSHPPRQGQNITEQIRKQSSRQGRKEAGTKNPEVPHSILRGGGRIVSHINCRLEVSNLSYWPVSDHRGSRPRLHPEVTPGNLQLPGGDFLNVVLMGTEILNGFNLIMKISTRGWETSGSALPQLLTVN